MSSTTSAAPSGTASVDADGLVTPGFQCPCNIPGCNVIIYKFPARRREDKALCCGLDCPMGDRMTDSRHFCVICNALMCGMCGIANIAEGSSPEPLKQECICNRHVDYCQRHGIEHKQTSTETSPSLPRAVSNEEDVDINECTGDEERTILDSAAAFSLFDQLFDKLGWEHVRTTTGYVNTVNRVGKNGKFPSDRSKLTRFQGIVIPGEGIIPPGALKTNDHLRPFVLKRLGMKGYAGKNKRPICEAIAVRHVEYEEKKKAGDALLEFMPGGANDGDHKTIKMKRFLNTLLHRRMRQAISTDLFARLKKDELEDGEKTCEKFGKLFIGYYNNKHINNANAYDLADFDQDASVFDPLPHSAWILVVKKLKDVMAEYEKAYVMSKESGYNKKFEDLDVVMTNPHLKYLHFMLEELSETDLFRQKLCSELPGEVFHQSTQPPGPGGSRGGISSGGESAKSAKIARARGENAAMKSIADKNEAVKIKVQNEISSDLHKQLYETEDRLEKKKDELKRHCGGNKKEAKKRVKAYQEWKEKANATKGDSDSSSGSSSSEQEFESQETLVGQIIKLQEREEDIKSQIQLYKRSKH